ncbi:MAG TPA: pilus assembly protein TadG-related protein [Chloroflexota bacterium]|nr:pilus assembly protein TadG-related protein [Chloroflexota bacterium]
MTLALRLRHWLERAVVAAWVAVMMPFFLTAVGLTLDGGLVFDARRELQNTADAAARAGAMQVDQQVYRDSNGTTVVLDQDGARATAAQYVSSQEPDVQAVISSDDQHVLVSVSRDVPTNFLRIAGIDKVHIAATAPAEVRYGIDKANK